MLTRTDLRSSRLGPRELAQALPRATLDVTTAQAAVAPLIEDVRSRGAAALRDAAERFDGVRPVHLRVPAQAIDQALGDLDPAVREALEMSIAHNRAGHAAQVPTERATQIVPGGTVAQRWVPVRRVGLYVPGGLAVYPSSVVMNAVAAQVAGVEQIALASPPQAEFGGLPHPTILAACALLGLTEVYAVGGAQAIAMLAYGAHAQDDTDRADVGGEVLCQQVDVITGPGNVYVAAAKRAVMGVVGIDAEAGPTEIAVLADAGANPEYVAADLLSQAEHDPNAGSVLITDSPELADAVDAALERRLSATRHRARAAAALTGPQSGTVLVRDLDQAIEVRRCSRGRPSHPQCRCRLHRPLQPGSPGGLPGRFQPCAAHRRHRPFRRRAECDGLPQTSPAHRVQRERVGGDDACAGGPGEMRGPACPR